MNDIFDIEWEGKKYPARYIRISTFGNRLISVGSLDESLMPGPYYEYINEKAKRIDEMIFFYVNDSLISKDEKTLGQYVYKYAS